MSRVARLILSLCLSLTALAAGAAPSSRDTLAAYIRAPMELGPQIGDDGVYSLLNSGGAETGYVFETEPMAPLPGFSGAPVNVLVVLDLDGRFIDVKLINHNEPIFVSGLPEHLFYDFFDQYRGHSINETLVVGNPYGKGGDASALVYLDGVTKATASVRIAHESILAATLQVAREKMGGVSTGPPAQPDPSVDENLTWDDLVTQDIVTRLTISNAEVNDAFAGTLWERDDPDAQSYPDETYLDLYVVDLGPPSVARAVLSDSGYETLRGFQDIATSDEPILVVETGRHGLVGEEFTRNTSPDLISAEQGGFPVALRDADLLIELSDDVPDALHEAVHDGRALILRTDRRLGFDPASPWTLNVKAVREHGMFKPEIGTVPLSVEVSTAERFYTRPQLQQAAPAWVEAIRNRAPDLIVLALFLVALSIALGVFMNRLAGHRFFTPIRLGILAFVTGFVGWWGQGQLSIVTPLGVLRTAVQDGSYAFLLYDPFSLLIWIVTIGGFIAWGRGLFCGWLCPFGALQEFAAHLGRLLRIPQIEPSALWDNRLKWLKYVILAALVIVVLTAPARLDKAAEVEPFKTAITTFFIREWYYVAYAVFWLLLSMTLFKGFCRYVCPLGAVMAIGGLVRGRDWIERRAECGTPCQLCRVKCSYGAIEKSGRIDYSECFQCLDCVAIHDDPERCVPLITDAKRRRRAPSGHPNAQGVPAE